MYELLEHQSEVGIKACGNNIIEAFQEASIALCSIMCNPESVLLHETTNIIVKGNSYEELFAALMNEIISITSINNAFYSKHEYAIHEDNGMIILEGVLSGEIIDTERHEIRTEPKAATYSGLKVWEENNKTCVQIIIDV